MYVKLPTLFVTVALASASTAWAWATDAGRAEVPGGAAADIDSKEVASAALPFPNRTHESLVRSTTLSKAGETAHVRSNRDYNPWKISLIPLAATQALDVSSSFGMRELNPALSGSSGTFGAQSSVIKLGAVAAMIGIEYLLVKKHPSSARILSKMNWTGAAVTGAFALHNFAIR